MDISNPLSFIGNLIALITLSWKTLYDLIINPRLFNQELKSIDTVQAAKNKRNRTDNTTAITFMILALSYAILILETLL